MTNLTFDSPAFDDSLSYKVPEALRSVAMPLIPAARVVTQWKADPKKELINPWRYWTLDADTSLQKQTLIDGPVKVPTGGQKIRLTGDFGKGSRLNYTIGKDYQLPPGRYRFSCRVRGTPGLTTGFEVGDGWHGLTDETPIPLTAGWQEHVIEFEIKDTFKDETTLRFKLPKNDRGQFDLTDTHLREMD